MSIVRKWSILGTNYPVVRTPDLDKSLEGEYDYTVGEIRINDNIPPHRFWEVESHELAHAVAYAIGMKNMLRDVFGLSEDVATKLEEEWIARFLPVYLDTLERNGRLSPPEPPLPGAES